MRSLVGPYMEDLPENVMVDILSRLPVKTIIHCKCVCNKWLDLLSDSYFANLHLLRSPAGLMIHHNSLSQSYINPGVLKWVEVEDELDHHNLHHDPVMSLDLNLAPIFQESAISPLGSVNGFICLLQYGPKGNNTYICNPITREYMILPRPYHIEAHKTLSYGFGMGTLTNEYKVIRIFRPDSISISQAEVYTVGTGQWKRLSHVPYYWPNRIYGQFLSGHAHWTVIDHNKSVKICAFDFDKETFELFPSPPSEEERQFRFQSMGVLKGCLCRYDGNPTEFRIWVMKEYGIKKSWHKEVVIKQGINPDSDRLMWDPMLIEGLKDGTILMVYHEYKLVAYCTRRKTFVDMNMFDRWFNGLKYRPSFQRLHNFENERVHVF